MIDACNRHVQRARLPHDRHRADLHPAGRLDRLAVRGFDEALLPA
ncbi:MAG: hypothetical protein ACOCTI_00855 [Phycisphaeraceae bacterium]